MRRSDTLIRLRNYLRRDDPAADLPFLSGPTLVEQEPELMHETARRGAGIVPSIPRELISR